MDSTNQTQQKSSKILGGTEPKHKFRISKLSAMYLTMVAVSTCTIFLLEHVSIFNAVRTALVAAVAKTFAANWVSTYFD